MSTGLIGYWKLDEGSGLTTIDSTGYGNNGTLIGNPTWTASVAPTNFTNTNCLNFNGSSSYVSIPKIPLTEKISISAWFKSGPYTGGSPTIFGARSNGTNGNEIVVQINGTNDVGLWFIMGDDTQYQPHGTFITGSWNHIVTTCDSISASVYINGSLKQSIPISGTINTRTNPSTAWMIGHQQYDPSNNRWFSGSIDDLRIYNRALTPAEITGLYSGSIQPLAGAWNVIRGNPTAVAIDSSGNNNTGTYIGSPSPCNAPPALIYDKLGTGVTFNGTSQYVSASNVAFSGLTSLSLTAWYKTTETKVEQFLIYHNSTNANGFLMEMINSTFCTLSGQIGNGTTLVTVSEGGAISSNDGNWHHAAMTWDGTTIKIYRDGVFRNSQLLSGSLPTTTNGVGIGQGNTAAKYFNGSIDDVRIYNRALTSGEIATLASGSIGATDSSLIAWYKFNTNKQSMIKGNPTAVAIDSSGNNNTGTYIANPSPCNAPSALVYDKLGTGVTFNGSSQGVSSQALGQYISTTLDVSNLPSKTYAGWFYWSSLANSWQGMVGQADGFDNNKTTGLITDATNKISIYQAYGGVIGFIANAALAPTLNTWYHIAGVIDKPNNRIQLYINGSSVSSPSVPTMASSSFTTISNKVGIGFMLGGGSYKFNGSVDDVRIYNKALSQAEITDLASGNIGLTDSTLNAWYKFNTNKQSKI